MIYKDFYHGERFDFLVFDSDFSRDEAMARAQITSKNIHEGMEEVCIWSRNYQDVGKGSQEDKRAVS